MNVKLTALSEARGSEERLDAFCGLGEKLRPPVYRSGLMAPHVEKMLIESPWPFEREHWVAWREGVPVGRVAAATSQVDSTRGTVGMFEVREGDDEAARLLLETAERWLHERGVDTAYGPVTYNTWFPYRFRTDPPDGPSMSWEPSNPPSYPRLWQENGYEPAESYHSDELKSLAQMSAMSRESYERAMARGFRLREIRTDERLREQLPALYRISMTAFVRNPLFEPISERAFMMLYAAQASKRKSLGSYLLRAPDDTDVGYVVNFVDERGQFVIKTWAVLPAWQGKGLSYTLLHAGAVAAQQAGHVSGVGALMHDGNRSEHGANLATIGWRRRYVLFRKRLSHHQ